MEEVLFVYGKRQKYCLAFTLPAVPYIFRYSESRHCRENINIINFAALSINLIYFAMQDLFIPHQYPSSSLISNPGRI